jgi:hypothetical protein
MYNETDILEKKEDLEVSTRQALSFLGCFSPVGKPKGMTKDYEGRGRS